MRFSFLVGVWMMMVCGCAAQRAAAVDVQQLIDDAIASGQTTLVIPPGTYPLTSPGNGPHLTIQDADGLTITAYGVTLICTEVEKAINITDCHNLTLRGLTIDHDPLPFTQGTVVAVAGDDSWFDVHLHDGYPDVAASHRVIVFDPATRKVKAGTWTRYSPTITQQGNRTVRVDMGRPIHDTLQVGDFAAISRPYGSAHGIVLRGCTNTTLEDVTLYTSTCFGFLELYGGGNTYLGCAVTPGPLPAGATQARLLSTLADGFHSKHTHQGPRVENCTFDSMGDDGIAINGDYALVVDEQGGVLTVLVKRQMTFEVGDRLRGVRASGQTTVDVLISAVQPATMPPAFDAAAFRDLHLPELREQNVFEDAYDITLAAPLNLQPGEVVSSPDRNGAGFVVRNNTIRNGRARGILIKASGGVIEDNTVTDLGMAGIALAPEIIHWMEADFSRHVDILNNTVRGVNRGPYNIYSLYAGAISVIGENAGGISPAGGHRDIRIAGNVIDAVVGPSIVVTSAADVAIEDNRIYNTQLWQAGTGSSFGIDTGALVWLGDVDAVTLEGNTYYNPGPFLTSPVVAGAGVTNATGLTDGVTAGQ